MHQEAIAKSLSEAGASALEKLPINIRLDLELNCPVDSGQVCNVLSLETHLLRMLVLLVAQMGISKRARTAVSLQANCMGVRLLWLVARQRARIAKGLCFEEIQSQRHVELQDADDDAQGNVWVVSIVQALRWEAVLKAASSTLATIAPTMVSLATFTDDVVTRLHAFTKVNFGKLQTIQDHMI
ncbi:unnamed protein product [Symbiodinium microadriaticum]|nr:unnamed protein product [Symbiodinium microadriaticum]